MNIKEAIDLIKYNNTILHRDALQYLLDHFDESKEYLYHALDKAIQEKNKLERTYQLHFYALFLLGELQDKSVFPKILELVSNDKDTNDYLIGDLTTSGLNNILYSTYNGDIDLLKNVITNETIDSFVRSACLNVIAQLYLDGILKKEEFKGFLKDLIYSNKEHDYVYSEIACILCDCHFVDMLSDIKYMLENGLMDTMVMGTYDCCVDSMFSYKHNNCFCEKVKTIKMLNTWAMFENREKDIDPEEFRRLAENWQKQQNKKYEIGPYDLCYCGSGQKYKFCCMKKPKSKIYLVESYTDRMKALDEYPYLGDEREENRIYLDDCFSKESIEIDQLLYLALKQRGGYFWNRDRNKEMNRTKLYLSYAFEKFKELVERENITSFVDYDNKYSIHYSCEEWMAPLLDLIKTDNDYKDLVKNVKKCMNSMNK